MTDEQAERLIEAVGELVKVQSFASAIKEEQIGLLNDIHRRLAEIAEVMQGPKERPVKFVQWKPGHPGERPPHPRR